MTKREFYTSVITLAGDNSELAEMALAELNALDLKNEKAKAKRVANAVANEPIEKAILAYLNGHANALASELANACDISTSKVVAVTKKMVDNGTLTCKRVKIATVGERNSYSLHK